MKKKLLALLLALTLIFSVAAACNRDDGSPEEPYELNEVITPEEPEPEEVITLEARAFQTWTNYIELVGATQTFELLTDYTELTGVLHNPAFGAWAAEFTMDMKIDISIMTLNVKTTGYAAQIVTDEKNMETYVSMTMDMGMFGGEIEMISYTNMVDSRMSMRMIADGYELPGEIIGEDTINEMMDDLVNLPEFGEDDIVAVKIEESGNYTTYHFIIDMSVLNDFMEEVIGAQMGDIMEMLGDDVGMSMEFDGDMPMTLVVYGPDEIPVSLAMDMSMNISFSGEAFEEMDGEDMFITASILYTYTAFGDDVVITEPPPGAAMATPGVIIGEFVLAEELFGTWDWDYDETFTFTFYSDGTGSRGFPEEIEEFKWVTTEEYLFIINEWDEIESWVFVIEDGVLTIDSQDVPGFTFSYIKR